MTRQFGIKVEARTIAGDKVFLRSMSGGSALVRLAELLGKIQTGSAAAGSSMEAAAILAANCLCEEDGMLIFAGDVAEAEKHCSMGFLMELLGPALEVSGAGDDAKAIAGN